MAEDVSFYRDYAEGASTIGVVACIAGTTVRDALGIVSFSDHASGFIAIRGHVVSVTVESRKTLRRDLRLRRRQIAAADRIAAAEHLADRLLALPALPAHGYVAGYWAVDGEIGLHALQLRLPGALTYCLPVLHDDGRLRFAPWRSGAPLVTNRHGIPEPDVADDVLIEPDAMACVIAPLVGFDVHRQRLGMGAGWYDCSFAFRLERAAPPLLVGAAFAMQQVDRLDIEPWDVPLDAICTERQTFTASDFPA